MIAYPFPHTRNVQQTTLKYLDQKAKGEVAHNDKPMTIMEITFYNLCRSFYEAEINFGISSQSSVHLSVHHDCHFFVNVSVCRFLIKHATMIARD